MQNVSPIGWAILPLRKYATFSGRAGRAEFWWFFLFVMIIYFGALFIAGGMGAGLASMNVGAALVSGNFNGFIIVIALFWLLFFIPMLAVQIRRLHDTNRSGWWLGAFWLLYVIYMVVTLGFISPAMQNTGTPPNFARLAAAGILALLVFVYSIVLLVFFCLRGTEGPNRFGEDPYGEDVAEVFA